MSKTNQRKRIKKIQPKQANTSASSSKSENG